MGLLDRIWTRKLSYFEFPGGGYSMQSLGLDEVLHEQGFTTVSTPRHADVLIVSGPVTHRLAEPLRQIHAEIPRPRYVVVIGEEEIMPVPVDTYVPPEADALEETLHSLQMRIAGGYRGAPPLEDAMHSAGHSPEDPGQHEVQAGQDTDGMVDMANRGVDHGGETHGETEHGGCGMENTAPADMDHGDMDNHHMMMGSAYESEDGLALETVEMPLGPVHPATPGGLGLTVTLDGDLVAGMKLEQGYLSRDIARSVVGEQTAVAQETFRRLDPRTPVSVPLLYCRALEDLAGIEVPEPVGLARIYLLEIERISSHLLWFAGFARVLGVETAGRRMLSARRPLLRVLNAARQVPGGVTGDLVRVDLDKLHAGLRPARKALEWGGILPYRLEGLAVIRKGSDATGPVARASGAREDARTGDSVYASLGFKPVVEEWGDALARYTVRVREVEESLRLAGEALRQAEIGGAELGPVPDGEGHGVLEGPRGRAEVLLKVEEGRVTGCVLDLPSQKNAELLPDLIQGVSLSDAVAALWSLDLSVEEMDG